MHSRLGNSDRVAALAAAAGVLVSFLPWYSYYAGDTQVTVDGFRASLLGDIFFLTAVALALLLLMQHGAVSDIVRTRVSPGVAYLAVTAVATGAVLDQLLLARTGHRSIAPGLFMAVVVVAAMAGATVLRTRDRPATPIAH